MKRFYITLIAMFLIQMANARTIHWITFVDTEDEKVGEYDVNGRKVLYSNFINPINAALATEDYKAQIHDYYGVETTPQNCKKVIQNLRVEPDDVVVFYYIGHGGRANTSADYTRQHPWPQMCMQTIFPESMYMPLEWVHKELSSKGARLSVAIAMCCNSEANWVTPKEEPKFALSYGASYAGENKIERIKDLFLRSKGNLVATSTTPGTYSWSTVTSYGKMDAYSSVICKIFDTELEDMTEPLTWQKFLTKVSDDTYNYMSRIGKNQRPIHDVSGITTASIPPRRNPESPSIRDIDKVKEKTREVIKKRDPETTQSWKDELSGQLNQLINVHLGEDKRMDLEENLGTLFTADAQVRSLAKDYDTSINRESAEDFLGRLATSRILLGITVVDGEQESDGTIKSLKIREVYKK